MNSFIHMTKQQARAAAASIASACSPDYFLQAGNEICRTLSALSSYQAASTVFCYVSTKKEPSTIYFLQKVLADGKRLVVPKSEPGGIMRFFVIDDLCMLSSGRFGILEPSGGEEIDAQEIDFSVIPCVAMSLSGQRLGHGCGYYDRFLSTCRPPCVAVCACRLLVEQLPTEPHDKMLEMIVTEKGIILPSPYLSAPAEVVCR